MPPLMRDFVTTSVLATMSHLQRFLCRVLMLPEEEAPLFELFGVVTTTTSGNHHNHSSSSPVGGVAGGSEGGNIRGGLVALSPLATLHEAIGGHGLDSGKLELLFRYTALTMPPHWSRVAVVDEWRAKALA